MANKKGLEQQVSPKWKFLQENLGFKATLNMFGPYIGAGISVDEVNESKTRIEVSMVLNWFNENYVGTQFGGSLYSMGDPFYMFILMANLGEDYLVWDKKAEIEFVRPGTGKVSAVFEISEDELNEIRQVVAEKKKTDWVFQTEITGEDGEVVARLIKTLYIRGLKKKK